MDNFIDYIKETIGNKELVIAEIGVRSGENAIRFLEQLPVKQLFLIDNYLPYLDTGSYVTQERQDKYYQEMFHKLLPQYEKTILVTLESEKASRLFPDEFFDLVYIDANHEEYFVKRDIDLWWTKVRQHGIMTGHDSDVSGVFAAIDYFLSNNSVHCKIYPDNEWAIYKKVEQHV